MTHKTSNVFSPVGLKKMWKHILLLQIFSMLQAIPGDVLQGHMKHLGEHRSPEIKTKAIIGDLHPLEFWEKFVKPGVPVLFPGEAKNSE